MSSIHDQELIEALRSDGPHELLRICVGVRCPERRLQDPGTLGAKDLVEASHVLRVTVPDEELDLDAGVFDVTGHVPALLRDPEGIRVRCDPRDPDPSSAQLEEKEHVETMKEHGVDAEKVGRHDLRGLSTEELPPGRSSARC